MFPFKFKNARNIWSKSCPAPSTTRVLDLTGVSIQYIEYTFAPYMLILKRFKFAFAILSVRSPTQCHGLRVSPLTSGSGLAVPGHDLASA